jgi:FAD:protein FMN transferase
VGSAVVSMAETRFLAMGTDVHVVVVGGDDSMLALAEARVADLERRWSRFLDASEVSVLNRQAGRPVVVSPETFDLVSRAVAAWRATAGRFDPTVGATLAAHGYDRDFAEVAAGDGPAAPAATGPTPGAGGIDLLPGLRAVTVPPGVTFDPGGIGKGLAADLTAHLLLEGGADGVLVNLGGDLRAAGRAPSGEGWIISVPDPLRTGRELLRVALPEGAVATSSRLQRRWRTAVGEAHHLIDPSTGRPAETDVVAVTVVAAEAWWAESLTKALFLAGPAGLDGIGDAHAVVVTADGGRHATPDLATTLR